MELYKQWKQAKSEQSLVGCLTFKEGQQAKPNKRSPNTPPSCPGLKACARACQGARAGFCCSGDTRSSQHELQLSSFLQVSLMEGLQIFEGYSIRVEGYSIGLFYRNSEGNRQPSLRVYIPYFNRIQWWKHLIW